MTECNEIAQGLPTPPMRFDSLDQCRAWVRPQVQDDDGAIPSEQWLDNIAIIVYRKFKSQGATQ